MAKLTFTGGIHTYDGKDLSKDKPIVDILPRRFGISFVAAYRCTGSSDC